MAFEDRLKSLNVMIERVNNYPLNKALMVKNGDILPWDTSDIQNAFLFFGIVFENFDKFQILANKGEFETSLADGTYYANSNGDLVNTLPAGSFTHEVGRVTNGRFFINDNIFIDSGGGDTILITNNYTNSVLPPQDFNPTLPEVLSGSATFTLSGTSEVFAVSINGQDIDESEWSLIGSSLTVTPDLGFKSILDEILVSQSNVGFGSTGVLFPYREVTTTDTMTLNDHTVNAISGTFTITLPNGLSSLGRHFVITNSGKGLITVDGFLNQTINGLLSYLLTTDESIEVVSDGLNWRII